MKLWSYLSNKKKFQLKIYAFVTIFTKALQDSISIGSVIPFVMVLIEPNKVMEFIFFTKLFKYLNLTSISEIKFFLCIAFSLAVILSGFIKISLSWFQSRLSMELQQIWAIMYFQVRFGKVILSFTNKQQ